MHRPPHGLSAGGRQRPRGQPLTSEHWRSSRRTACKGASGAPQRRVLRAFRRRGLLEEDTAADMLGWQASGGFSVDGSVRVEGHDRAGVERLVRYCARGPLALERLHAMDGQGGLASPQVHASTSFRVGPLPAYTRTNREIIGCRSHSVQIA